MKKVLGKELVLTEDAVKKIFVRIFNERGLNIHDLWNEPNVGIHIKLAKIGESKNLRNQGFEEVKADGKVAKYSAKEVIDERILQLIQCEAILKREW